MKKLGKKVSDAKGTLMAYACSCGSCPCATSNCTCRNNPSSTHMNALISATNAQFSMRYSALEIGN